MATITFEDPLPVRKPGPRRGARRTPETGAVLAAAARAQADVQAAEARKLAAGVEWARLHQVTDTEDAETWGEDPTPLTGEGAPLLARGCVAEFAAVIGTTTGGGRAFLANAIELAHRLPALYAEIQAGRLPAWKGRRIATETTILPRDAAAALDEALAPVARKLSARATQQAIDEAIAQALPQRPQEIADSYSTPHLTIDHRQISFQGTSTLSGALDLADALDLEAALTREAEALRQAGSTATLDARRAMALGRLARGEAATGRTVTLYVHLPADTNNPTALLENADQRLLTQSQVAQWCRNPDVKVVLKPVIDLNTVLTSNHYVVPDPLKLQVQLRDRTCVFPYCNRPAWNCQKDHITPHAQGGQTASTNLGSLCQQHHNLKTHGGWTYQTLAPGIYLWRSPHGYKFLRDHHGTQNLTPRPVDPPGS